MLILNRNTSESIIIGDDVKTTVKRITRDANGNAFVTFEIDAPDEVEAVLSKMEKTTNLRKVR